MPFNSDFFKYMPPVTKNLLFINIFVILAVILMPASKQEFVDSYLLLHPFWSKTFNMAQLITYMLFNTSPSMMLFTILTLLFMSPSAEMALGSKRFLFYVVSCGIGTALIYQLLSFFFILAPIGGAMGIAFAVLLAYGMLFPERQIFLLIPPIPIKAKWLVLGFALIEVLFMLSGRYGVYNIINLAAMLVGFCIIYYWKKKGIGNGFY